MSSDATDNLEINEEHGQYFRELTIKDIPEINVSAANASPLGGIGYGITAIVVGFANTSCFTNDIIVWMTALFSGGLIQLIAGILEIRRRHMFNGTAFVSFGCYWFSQVAIWVLNKVKGYSFDKYGSGTYLLVWGIYTILMFIPTLKMRLTSQIIYVTLFLVYFFLAIGDYTGNSVMPKIAGACGILSGITSIYSSIADLTNHEFGYILVHP